MPVNNINSFNYKPNTNNLVAKKTKQSFNISIENQTNKQDKTYNTQKQKNKLKLKKITLIAGIIATALFALTSLACLKKGKKTKINSLTIPQKPTQLKTNKPTKHGIRIIKSDSKNPTCDIQRINNLDNETIIDDIERTKVNIFGKNEPRIDYAIKKHVIINNKTKKTIQEGIIDKTIKDPIGFHPLVIILNDKKYYFSNYPGFINYSTQNHPNKDIPNLNNPNSQISRKPYLIEETLDNNLIKFYKTDIKRGIQTQTGFRFEDGLVFSLKLDNQGNLSSNIPIFNSKNNTPIDTEGKDKIIELLNLFFPPKNSTIEHYLPQTKNGFSISKNNLELFLSNIKTYDKTLIDKFLEKLK